MKVDKIKKTKIILTSDESKDLKSAINKLTEKQIGLNTANLSDDETKIIKEFKENL